MNWYFESSSPPSKITVKSGIPEFASANGGVGPYATDAAVSRKLEVGDVIQLSNEEGRFYHTLIISDFTDNDVLVCAHSDDALDRPLSSYNYAGIRVLHVEGARLFFDDEARFQSLLDGTALPPKQSEA